MSIVSPAPVESSAQRRARRLGRLRSLALNLLFSLAVVGVAYSLFVTWQVRHGQTVQKAQEVARMRSALAQVEAQNEELRAQVRFLKTPAGVERLAREKLGLVRPDETAYVVINAPPVREDPPARRRVESAPTPGPGRFARCLNFLAGLWTGGD